MWPNMPKRLGGMQKQKSSQWEIKGAQQYCQEAMEKEKYLDERDQKKIIFKVVLVKERCKDHLSFNKIYDCSSCDPE